MNSLQQAPAKGQDIPLSPSKVVKITKKPAINRPQIAIEMMLGGVRKQIEWLYKAAIELLDEADAHQHQSAFDAMNAVEICLNEAERLIAKKHAHYDSLMDDVVYLDSLIRIISTHCLTDNSCCKDAALRIVNTLEVTFLIAEIESEAEVLQ